MRATYKTARGGFDSTVSLGSWRMQRCCMPSASQVSICARFYCRIRQRPGRKSPTLSIASSYIALA